MRFSLKTFLANGFLALLVAVIIMFMVFAVRTILDPMYKNPELILTSKQIFSIFIWPYNFIEKQFIGVNPDFSHRFSALWSPVGAVCTLIYLILFGNLVYWICRIFLNKKPSQNLRQ